ncbi:MAG: hypothetical protein AAFR31_19480 [Cyanobacteria bacterium J06627_8]
MNSSISPKVSYLSTQDVALTRSLLKVFGDAFDDVETDFTAPPTTGYLQSLLSQDHVIALAALVHDEVVRGLVA